MTQNQLLLCKVSVTWWAGQCGVLVLSPVLTFHAFCSETLQFYDHGLMWLQDAKAMAPDCYAKCKTFLAFNTE